MSRPVIRKFAALGALFLFAWLALRYLMPLLLPFLLGAGLALAAEPMVGFLSDRLHLPRAGGALLGVSGAILLLLGFLILAGSALVRELGALASALPDLETTFRQGLTLLEDFLISLTDRTPDGVRSLLTRSVLGLSRNGTALLDQAAGQLPGLLSRMISHVPDSALALGTGLISAFMISIRLPKWKRWCNNRIPQAWRQEYLPALQRMRHALGGWLKAQLKLMLVTYFIVAVGLLAFRVPYAPIWAAGVALVDALPLLGTGTVLLPWSFISLLQGNAFLALGLVGIYAAAALTRSAIEPKLVGRQLGLDPLVTLVSLYIGYRIWGIFGMLLAPMLSVAAIQLAGEAIPPSNDK